MNRVDRLARDVIGAARRLCPSSWWLSRPSFLTLVVVVLGMHHPNPLPAAPPVAEDDSFTTSTNTLLSVPAPGVLANDTAGAGSLSAVLLTAPGNGVAILGDDGALSYTPQEGFVGTDSFTYLARSTPGAQVFSVDATMSQVDLIVSVSTDLGNDTERADELDIIGTLTGLPSPSNAPFSSFHIQDLELTVNEDASLVFCLATFFGNCIAGLEAESSAGEITLTMNTPGPAAPVDTSGRFNQLDNLVDFSGVINVTPTGLASDAFPAGPQILTQTALPLDIAGATIVQSGSSLILTVPIDFEGSFVIDLENNITADVDLQGVVVATSPIQPVEDSNPATITIEVGSPDTDGDGMPDHWETSNGLDPLVEDDVLDPDGDGWSNLAEYTAGTDPHDPTSRFAITAMLPNGAGYDVTFQSVIGKSYLMETSADQLTWEPSSVIDAIGSSSTFLWVPGKEDTGRGFLRVRITPPSP